MSKFRRKRKKRSRHSKLNRYLSTGAKALVIGSTALKIAKQVKGLVNVEYKTFNTTGTAVNVTSSGVIYSLTNVVNGDNKDMRVGNTLKAKSLELNLLLEYNSGGNASQYCRLIIFIDKQNNQVGVTDPTVTSTYGLLETASLVSPPLTHNKGRYTILKDKTYVITDGSQKAIRLKYFKKLYAQIAYASSTTNPGQKNNIWMILMSKSASNYPTVDYYSRMRFIDN